MTAADTLAAALEREHREIEEEFLFPPLCEAGTVAAISVMLREHGEIWETLLRQLERHNFKEESIVYPQADAVRTARTSAGLSEFLAMSRVPVGWVCARADGGERP